MAAYERSTISSEVFFASTSISLRFRGRVSRISLPRQSENDQGYYKAHKPQQVHGRRDDGYAVRVGVEPEPVAHRRAVVRGEHGRRRRYEPGQGADAYHHQKAWTRPLGEKRHREQVRRPPDKHVNPGGEDVGERKVPESRELRHPARRYEAEVNLGGEAAGEDAAESTSLLQERGKQDAKSKQRRKLLLAVLQRDADQDRHRARERQDGERLGQDAPEVLHPAPEAEVGGAGGHQDQDGRQDR